MLAKSGDSSKNLALMSHKRTVSNVIHRTGASTVKSRHAVPLDLNKLFDE